MYYLKCEKCGHYNSVDSEFLVYCGKCKVHLINNYIDWVGVHPDKTFGDFRKTVCVTETEIPKQDTVERKPSLKRSVLEAVGPVKKKRQRLTRNQWIGIIVGAIAAAVFYQVGKYVFTFFKEKMQYAIVENTNFASPDTTNWELISFGEANFQILFPQQPVKNEQTLETPLGKLSVVQYNLEPKLGSDANLLYGVGYTVYPANTINSGKMSDEELDVFFKNSVDGTVSNVQGKLLSTLIIDYEGYPGREIKIDIKEGLAIIKMRSYLVENKMYIIQVITPVKNNFNTSINYFLDSFKLID